MSLPPAHNVIDNEKFSIRIDLKNDEIDGDDLCWITSLVCFRMTRRGMIELAIEGGIDIDVIVAMERRGCRCRMWELGEIVKATIL